MTVNYLAFLILQQILIVKSLFLFLTGSFYYFAPFIRLINYMNTMLSYFVALHLGWCCPIEISMIMEMFHMWALQCGRHQSHMANDHLKCG